MLKAPVVQDSPKLEAIAKGVDKARSRDSHEFFLEGLKRSLRVLF